MSASVIEIGKQKYVCGLFWQSLSRPRELKAEAAELARKLNFDLLVLRKDLGLAQVGFASSREGAHKGMLSLGAIVASTMAVKGVQQDGRRAPATSWLAALHLDDQRWAYFAVRDESFLPTGDFAGSKSAVLERLYADYGLGGWNAIIGDAELASEGFHDFQPATIEEFLPRSRGRRPWLASAWELVPVHRSPKSAWVAAGVGALALGTLGGAWWYRQHVQQQALEQAQALKLARQRQAAALEPQRPVPPWPGQPTPGDFARVCTAGLQLMAPGGWRLEDYTCTSTRVRYVWSRGESNVAYLLEQVPQATVDLSGDKARHEEPLAVPPGPAEPLLAAQPLLAPMQARLQQLGLHLALQPPPAAPARPNLPGVRQLAPPPPDWQAFTFSLATSGVSPLDAAAALTRPGVRVNSMTFRQGQWTIEGVAYAK